MLTLTVPKPRTASEANAQAVRYERAKAIIAEGYTFWPEADIDSIAVCKPGRLSADYFITADGCGCPDGMKGNFCKHSLAAYILQEEAKEEAAADAARIAAYEAQYDACEDEKTGCDPHSRY